MIERGSPFNEIFDVILGEMSVRKPNVILIYQNLSLFKAQVLLLSKRRVLFGADEAINRPNDNK
jgi:hypothetical protein